MLRDIIRPTSILEILILASIFYIILKFVKGTRGAQLLKGLIFAFAILFLGILTLVRILELYHIKEILQWVFSGSFLLIIIVFAPEIRRGLSQIAQSSPFRVLFKQTQNKIIDEITRACINLSAKKIGGLIIIERSEKLTEYVDSGNRVDGIVSSELIESIFYPISPLHDGAIIVQNDRIAASACVLPLTEKTNLPKSVGTRHRAAIGITEETDCIAIVMSEETGKISVCIGGNISSDFNNQSTLTRFLNELYSKEKQKQYETTTPTGAHL
jgi:diadenylate cyclase